MTQEKKVKTITKFEDIDSSAMVNIVKAQRAFNAVIGKAKPQTAEVALVGKIRMENPDIINEDLVVEIYKGLGGLLNKQKAQINRINEVKDKKKKNK